jgi:hypothetical protein
MGVMEYFIRGEQGLAIAVIKMVELSCSVALSPSMVTIKSVLCLWEITWRCK